MKRAWVWLNFTDTGRNWLYGTSLALSLLSLGVNIWLAGVRHGRENADFWQQMYNSEAERADTYRSRLLRCEEVKP